MKKSNIWYGMGQVFRFAAPHWILIASTLVAMGLYASGEGAYLLLMKPFLDAFRKAGDVELPVERLYWIGKMAILLAPFLGITAFFQYYLRGRVIWRLVADLRNAICRALMPQSLSFFEDRRSGDLMSRITNDAWRTQVAFQQMFGGIPEQAFHLLMGVVVAAMMNWKLLLVGTLVAPVIIVPIGYLARRIRRYGKEGLEKLSDLTDLMAQMFSGIRVIKAFKMEEAEIQEFEHTNDKFRGKMMKVVSARGMSSATVDFVTRTLIGAGVLVVTWLLVRGRMELEIGRLCIFFGGVYYAFNALRKLVKAYNHLQEAIPAADRIFEMIEHVPEVRDAPDAVTLERVERGIEFRDVTFAYDDEAVLQNISFVAQKGETVALVGRSGSGKSTLVALICRFYDVSSGAVTIDGVDVRKVLRDSLLDRIAIVSQQTFLFNRTIAENIRYGRPEASTEEVEHAARAANIHDFIITLPGGYDTLCGEFGAKLSGGQCQRIAIARAVLKNADILILDEAMAGLDAESEAQVRDALQKLMRDRTTFVISHDLPTIQNANRILVLRNGRLVAQGAHDRLMAKGGEYSSLYALQFADLAGGSATRRTRIQS